MHQCQAEVEHLGVVVGRDLDVAGFEIAVDDPLAVGVVDGVGDLGQKPRRPAW